MKHGIREKQEELEKAKDEYEKKKNTIETYEKENDINEILSGMPKNSNYKKDKVEEQIQNLENELNRLNDEKNYNKNQIELLESNLENAYDIESELEDLNQEILEMNENLSIFEKTKKYLINAREDFSSEYLGKMKASFLEYLKVINGVEIPAEFDINLDVKIDENGSNKELRYFSTGYKDLIYICMRLSLIDALYQEEKPFIVLDDPFINLDETKIKNIMDLLRKIKKNYQIIYFICHESRNF